MSTLKELQNEALAEAAAAKALAEKADSEKRDMSAGERLDFDAHMAKGKHLLERINSAKADAEVLAQAKAIARQIGPLSDDPTDDGPHADAFGRKVRVSPWAKNAAEVIRKSAELAGGRKALVSGTYGVPNPISTEIFSMGQVPTTFLDLIPTTQAPSDNPDVPTGNTFTFLRQVTRTNNAAIAADGTTKPTSVYTIEEVEDKYRIIAHLSEAIPLRYFDDHANLREWLRSEMEYGLRLALETQLVSGEGVIASGSPGGPKDEITGILETSGIVTQAFDTDIFRTCRKALSVLQAYGAAPTAYVLSLTDAETIDLAQDDASRYYSTGPFAAGPGTLWGLPRLTSTALSAGTAILADWNAAELLIRDEAELAVDTGGDLFEKNQTKMRVEGRFGFAVKNPTAFAKITTTNE